jgi:hypothetical protein
MKLGLARKTPSTPRPAHRMKATEGFFSFLFFFLPFPLFLLCGVNYSRGRRGEEIQHGNRGRETLCTPDCCTTVTTTAGTQNEMKQIHRHTHFPNITQHEAFAILDSYHNLCFYLSYPYKVRCHYMRLVFTIVCSNICVTLELQSQPFGPQIPVIRRRRPPAPLSCPHPKRPNQV